MVQRLCRRAVAALYSEWSTLESCLSFDDRVVAHVEAEYRGPNLELPHAPPQRRHYRPMLFLLLLALRLCQLQHGPHVPRLVCGLHAQLLLLARLDPQRVHLGAEPLNLIRFKHAAAAGGVGRRRTWSFITRVAGRCRSSSITASAAFSPAAAAVAVHCNATWHHLRCFQDDVLLKAASSRRCFSPAAKWFLYQLQCVTVVVVGRGGCAVEHQVSGVVPGGYSPPGRQSTVAATTARSGRDTTRGRGRHCTPFHHRHRQRNEGAQETRRGGGGMIMRGSLAVRRRRGTEERLDAIEAGAARGGRPSAGWALVARPRPRGVARPRRLLHSSRVEVLVSPIGGGGVGRGDRLFARGGGTSAGCTLMHEPLCGGGWTGWGGGGGGTGRLVVSR